MHKSPPCMSTGGLKNLEICQILSSDPNVKLGGLVLPSCRSCNFMLIFFILLFTHTCRVFKFIYFVSYTIVDWLLVCQGKRCADLQADAITKDAIVICFILSTSRIFNQLTKTKTLAKMWQARNPSTLAILFTDSYYLRIHL